MARQEENREDLLREATALVERIELEIEGFSEPLVAGFRRDGSASFFLEPEVVYQFNAVCQLRRAYLHGHLCKAEQGRLVKLTRRRTETAVELVRHDLTPVEAAQLLDEAGRRLYDLHSILEKGKFRIIGQVPPNAAVIDRVRHWLGCLPHPMEIAPSPRVG
jgi:hypothetical protein